MEGKKTKLSDYDAFEENLLKTVDSPTTGKAQVGPSA